MENNYQLSRIHNYVSGLMSKEEMYNLEREALDDPFLQDAIDGYRLHQGVDAKSLSLLQRRLVNRVEEAKADSNRRLNTWQRLAIGSTAAVIFVAACVLLLFRYFPNEKATTLTEVEIMQDEVYSVSIVPAADEGGKPAAGWDDLEKHIIENYSGKSHVEGLVQVSFELDENSKPKNISLNGDLNESLKQEINAILTSYQGWEGKQVNFEMDLHLINL